MVEHRSIWTTSVLENVEFIHKYMNNSQEKDSPEMRRIWEAVKEAGVFVVFGYSERAGASFYISQAFISPEGKIVLHRRKIKPTRRFLYLSLVNLFQLIDENGTDMKWTADVERSIWEDSQAESLTCVAPSVTIKK